MQWAYKKHIEQAGYDYPIPCLPSVKLGSQPSLPQQASPQQSTSSRSENTNLCSPSLESIPEEEAVPPDGHHLLSTMLGGIHQDF